MPRRTEASSATDPPVGRGTAERRRSVGEWSVLALLTESPAHGWALASQLEPGGEVGSIWSLSRPLVYRALELLRTDGLVEPVGASASTRGPSRTLFSPTRIGRSSLVVWLRERSSTSATFARICC